MTHLLALVEKVIADAECLSMGVRRPHVSMLSVMTV